MKRREFTRAQKAAIVLRSTNAAGRACCENCGLVLKRGDGEIDHKLAEALVVDKTKPLTLEDGWLLGKSCCHRGAEGKTAKDVAVIAKAVRCEQKHLGIKKRSTWNRQWRRKVSGETVRREI